ncbi:MAG: tetratricopeptide repeat protein [Prevotellaceae bacterium]|jgi:tetratricopeptide (TPR) repeat protein|nr:tetratricopeptide repeat protein [Prevotellaceae bacterium]
MKKNALNLVLGAVLILAFSACNKNMGALSADYFKVNPPVLENVGGNVSAEITARIPAKFFDKKSILTIMPVLVTADGTEFESEPASFQGEKVLDNYTVVPFESGGVISQRASFKFDESMRQSELYLEFTVKRGKKTYKLPRLKVADGVISTVSLLDAAALTPVLGEDKFQRIIKENQEASILFLIQQSNIRNSELKTREIQSLVQRLAEANWEENQKISQVSIYGYASPDGPQALNARLAEERELNSKNFISRELKKLQENPDINAKNTAEDWAGFQALMEKSDIQDKEVILRVLSMYSDPEQREREMRNIARTYTQVADQILPQLRRSRLNVTVDIIGKSDDEILSLLKSNPDALTLEEILYAANLIKGSASLNDQFEVYKMITEIYPDDYRAYNNMATIRFRQADYADAETWLRKALAQDSEAPEVHYNQGIIALVKGDMKAAEGAFGQATGTGEPLDEALGALYMMQGNYKLAESVMKNAPNTNNVALGKILAGDYDRANEILDLVPMPNATTYYLKAIVGARTNNKEEVYKGMRAAVMRDQSKAAYALKDVEFAKYLSDPVFMSIVKL